MCHDNISCTACELEAEIAQVKTDAAALGVGTVTGSLANCRAIQRMAEALPGLVEAPAVCTITPADRETIARARRLAEGGPHGADGPLARAQRGEIANPGAKARVKAAPLAKPGARSITPTEAVALIQAGLGDRVTFTSADGRTTTAAKSVEGARARRELAEDAARVGMTPARLKAVRLARVKASQTAAHPHLAAAMLKARTSAADVLRRQAAKEQAETAARTEAEAKRLDAVLVARLVGTGEAVPAAVDARTMRPISPTTSALRAEAEARAIEAADRRDAERQHELEQLETLAKRHRKAAGLPSILGRPPVREEP